MAIIRKIWHFIVFVVKKIIWHMKLFWMDYNFYLHPLHEAFLYPPSFYYKHSKEEIKEIQRREIESLRSMLKKFEEENNIQQTYNKI